jgi:VanZ family protein
VFAKHFLPAIAWFILSVVLLCLPGSTIPKYPWLAVIHADKWVHIILFFTLCILFSRVVYLNPGNPAQKKKWYLLILFLGIAYGTVMEFVQKNWIPNRSFEIADIAADSTGCLLAYIYVLGKFLKKG